MNLNHAIQHPSRVAWDGAASAAIDIRKFNDVVLQMGAVPLEVLEQQVDVWVAQQAR